MEFYMQMFDNSFWRSGYPVAIAILLVWWIGSKFFAKK